MRDAKDMRQLRRGVNDIGGRDMARRIKLIADHDCWPLWGLDGDDIGNIDPAGLPLGNATLERLKRWAETYDSWLDRADPADTPPPSADALEAFEAKGRALWKQLRQELGPAFEIHYYSTKESRLLPPL